MAVLAAPAKVLESAVQKRLYAQVSPQLTDAQHGFHLARSTESNLLNYMSDVMMALNRGFKLMLHALILLHNFYSFLQFI